MRRSVRFALFVLAALLGLVLLPSTASAAGTATGHAAAVQYLRAHGYLPTVSAARYAALKAEAAAQAPAPAAPAAGPFAPVAGPSFQGQDENDLAPSDSNGAIGPNSFIETINTRFAIYSRTGALIASAPSEALTGTAHGDLSDPQVFWDPATNRFYYEILNVNNDTLEIGFSKSNNPTTVSTGSFCNYDVNYGYGANLPDFPKLGDTQHTLMIGVNVFQNGQTFIGSDVDWMTKPAGTGTITTCPAQSTFRTGKVTNLKTTSGAQISTPVPAQQTDTSTTGWIAAIPNALPATRIELFKVTESGGIPVIPGTATAAVTVASFNTPPAAPQSGTTIPIDTLDGRLLHAVSAIDPAHNAVALWTAHAVAGGAGVESRWYEINVAGSNLFQSGKATSSSLDAYNPGIAPDRTVQSGGSKFGSDMVMGFTTSSSATFAADQMVSKVGTAAQSGFVSVKASPGNDQGFDCLQLGICRWGDYSGASADPAASLTGARGDVWLVNMWSKGGGPNPAAAEWGTWVWRATP